jgi:hypothetical protein
MSVEPSSQTANRMLDKRLLQRSVAALHARLGLTPDPTITGEQAQAITLATGVRPEDRVVSSEILRMRAEKE